MDLLKSLNEAQKRAVLHPKGPLLILAGAGAGKTRVISHRLVYLVGQGIEPDRILAITFTNKAVGEMRERIYFVGIRKDLVKNDKEFEWPMPVKTPKIENYLIDEKIIESKYIINTTWRILAT